MSEREVVALLYRLVAAVNQRDLDALIECFHPDYESVQPVHPERSFQGRARVAENWTWVFNRFDDFEAEVLDFAVRGCTVWSEWIWRATAASGRHTMVRGVMIVTVEDHLFRRGRLYMESMGA